MFINKLISKLIFSKLNNSDLKTNQSKTNLFNFASSYSIFMYVSNTLLFALFSFSLFSQVQICLGDDATVCSGQTVQINNCAPGSGGSPNNGISLTNPTTINLTDDAWSNNINIGFPFSFYGNTYNQCLVGSNGILSFNTANAGGYCSYVLTGGQTIPSSGLTASNNSIMFCYQDINPSLGGSIQYETVGTAPNRKFIVVFQNIYFFSCTTVCNYLSVILNETSNVIEMHIGNKPTCGTFNGGLAIQGIQNASGSAGLATPGRNNTVWTANQDGRAYYPAAPDNTTAYQVSQIPYIQVVGTDGDIQWENTLGETFPYNNGVLNVQQVPPGVTGYYLTGSACGASLGAVSDTTWISSSSISVNPSSTPDFCSDGVGTASANAVGDGPFTYVWMPGDQSSPQINNLFAGTYTVTVTNANGCQASGTVSITDNGAVASATSTDATCFGVANGTASASMNPPLGIITYNWYDVNGETTDAVSSLSAGIYHCEVSSSAGCIDTVEVVINQPIGVQISSISNGITVCPNDSVTLFAVGSGGSSPLVYTWITNGNVVGNSDTVHVATTQANQEFCLVLSEQCGSPAVQTCVIVANPEPIVPILVPNIEAGCQPITFTFFNNSTNSAQISSVYYNFGNGLDTTVSTTAPINSLFTQAQFYDVQVEITSIFGCVYTQIFENIVEVYPLPIADFVFSSNPTSELETMVHVLNNSSSNVVNWYYYSPSSTPSTSIETNPTFWFEPGVINAYDVQLIVESNYGCLDTVIKTLNVIPAITFFAPNTFTPDGDEFNQTWEFYANGIDESNFQLTIYNRWGQIIWETKDPKHAWDGQFNNTPVQAGIYTWKATLKDKYSDDIQEVKGMVQVLY